MLQEFKNHINDSFSFLKESKILIAISGGIDSVVLSHLAHQTGLNFALCHCNFQLRGEESDEDEVFVKELAKKLNVTVFTTNFDTNQYAKEQKLSTQVAARNLRYKWFDQLLQKHQFEVVLTAHNSNDNIETFLINATRGTGLEGLTGIPPINGNIIRPLLPFSRKDIETFAHENQIVWREDSSNNSDKYVRNKIRHQVIPILEEINPQLLETFSRTLQNLQESSEIVNDRIQDISKEMIRQENELIKLDVSKLEDIHHKKSLPISIAQTIWFY